MADITMCVSKECPDFLKCWRATAIPAPNHQSYADFYQNGDCEVGLIQHRQNIAEGLRISLEEMLKEKGLRK